MNRCLALLLAAFLALPAVAQEWPAKPLHLVVPYPQAATSTRPRASWPTSCSRSWVSRSSWRTRPGAGGMLAGDMVARSEPDGYTLFLAANGPLLYSPTIFNRPMYLSCRARTSCRSAWFRSRR